MRTQAVIIKKTPLKEHDELIFCYTKDEGKKIYQVKSIQKPSSKQKAHLDVLNLVDFSSVSGNGHPIIASAYCLQSHQDIKSSLPALAASYILLESFDKIVPENEHDLKLWNFLNQELDRYSDLAKEDTDWVATYRRSLQELLLTLGYGQETDIEELANKKFFSLQFAQKVLRF